MAEKPKQMVLETSLNSWFARVADGRVIGLSHLIYMERKADFAVLHLRGSSVQVTNDEADALAFALFDAPKHLASHHSHEPKTQAPPEATEPTSSEPLPTP